MSHCTFPNAYYSSIPVPSAFTESQHVGHKMSVGLNHNQTRAVHWRKNLPGGVCEVPEIRRPRRSIPNSVVLAIIFTSLGIGFVAVHVLSLMVAAALTFSLVVLLMTAMVRIYSTGAQEEFKAEAQAVHDRTALKGFICVVIVACFVGGGLAIIAYATSQ